MKKISIIIPCYNTERYVDRCLASITSQTIGLDNLEIICVDDASTDSTWLHLQEWERRFPDNIILIPLSVNQKAGTARNIGLNYASADLVAFIDSDDWVEIDYFEQLYKPMIQFDCDVVCCQSKRDPARTLVYFNEECSGETADRFLAMDTEEKTKQLFKDKIMGKAAWGKLIRKSFLMDHGIFFPENLVYEDNFWIPLLHIYVKRLYVIEKYLYHWFVNFDSITLSKNVDFHVDWITIQFIKKNEYERRGLFQKYREELEYDLLLDAAGFMSVLLSRYEEPSFSLYQLEKEFVTTYIPDYKSCKYAADFLTYSSSLLAALYSPMNRDQFQEFAQTINRVLNSLGRY